MIDSEDPFDVIFMDMWSLGEIPRNQGYAKILCCIDQLTGYVDINPTRDKTLEILPQATFPNLRIPDGITCLNFVDDDGVLNDILTYL